MYWTNQFARAVGAVYQTIFVGRSALAVLLLYPLVDLCGQINFSNQVVPLFSGNGGCTINACHGGTPGSGGGGGMRLTGTDDQIYFELVTEVGSSGTIRVDVSNPSNSLILTKPSGQTGHGGGMRPDWGVGQSSYNTTLQWIQEGAQRTPSSVSERGRGTGSAPDDFVLEQNFPNPFNPGTAIRFDLPEKRVVTLKIFDLAGGEVATLLVHEELQAGNHQRVWDGRDTQRRIVVSGIYFYRLVAGGFTKTMKMTLMR